MHAYDFILVLFSFVYAAAVTHILSRVGQIIIASKRVRLSYTVISVVTVITNAGLGQGGSAVKWPAQNIVIAPKACVIELDHILQPCG